MKYPIYLDADEIDALIVLIREAQLRFHRLHRPRAGEDALDWASLADDIIEQKQRLVDLLASYPVHISGNPRDKAS